MCKMLREDKGPIEIMCNAQCLTATIPLCVPTLHFMLWHGLQNNTEQNKQHDDIND
jgi:hypothetical protein